MNIYFTGYTKRLFRRPHTNFWPWQYIVNSINAVGFKAFHIKMSKIDFSKPNIYICWNAPDSIELIEKYNPHPDSVIIQKLTALDTSSDSLSWQADNTNFRDKLVNWSWPQYKKLEYLEKSGYRFFGFGAKTDINSFPEKRRIIEKYSDRVFWIPWGSMTVPHNDIMNAKPILSNFKYDLGYVGSKWGTYSRGNVWEWDNFLQPLVDIADKSYVAGPGTNKGVVSVEKHIEILKSSAICPIIHATGWKAEKGIMDRFWTIHSLGRFGVSDNLGIYDFFHEDEVEVELEAEAYLDKSIYYMRNPEKQYPYISKVLNRIKNEYNQQFVWKNILKRVFKKK